MACFMPIYKGMGIQHEILDDVGFYSPQLWKFKSIFLLIL